VLQLLLERYTFARRANWWRSVAGRDRGDGGGTSPEAHRAGLDRVIQAGGQPVSWVALAVELQRDWARQDTVQAIIEIVLTDRLQKEE